MLFCDEGGTLRFVAICVGSLLGRDDDALFIGRWPAVPPRFTLPILCGGLGIFRPAGAGMDLACVWAAEFCAPRDIGDPTFRPLLPRAIAAADLADTAGGVIRLTVGLENAPEEGRAPGLAFAPSMLSRVGLTFTRLRD